MVWLTPHLLSILRPMLMLLLIVLPPPCTSLSTTITSSPAFTYGSTFTCPSGSECYFTCTQSLAACLKTTFVCEANSSCHLECSQSLACSKGMVQCHPGAVCDVHCVAPGACYMLVCEGENCSQNDNFSLSSLFAITIRLTVVEAFVRHGYEVKNVFAVTDGSLQILCPDLPPLWDSARIQQMQNEIRKEVINIIKEMNSTLWLSFPNYTFSIIHNEVLIISGDINFVNNVLKIAMNDILSRTPWANYVELSYLRYDVSQQKAHYIFDYQPNNQYNVTYIMMILSKIMQDYGYDLLGLNRNSSFISVTMYPLNSTAIVADGQVFMSSNCSLPAPFYGSFCLRGLWYSQGTIIITLEDLIASPSNAHHSGSMMVNTVPFVVDHSSFSTDGNFSISLNGSLEVSNNSFVHVGGDLHLQSSTLILSDNASLVISSSFNSNNSSLVLQLSESNQQSIARGDTVDIQVATYTQFNGGFDNIALDNFNVNQSITSCPVSITPYYQDKRCIISVSLSDCSIPVSSNWKFILTLVLICTVIPLLGGSAVLIYFKKKEIHGQLLKWKTSTP